MKKYIILLLISLYTFSFAKELEINFNIPKGNIIFSKTNSKETKEIVFYDGNIKLNLDNDEYFFIFSAPNYPLIQRNIDVKKTTSPITVFFSKQNNVTVNGKVRSGNLNIGGAKVIFTNSTNLSYNTTTDILGNFKINLPKGDYKISVNKRDYKVNKKNSIIYQFINPNRPYNVNIDLIKIPSFIRGQAIDENGNSIPFPEISINTEGETIKLKGDEFGIFKMDIAPGIITILGKKEGYVENGVVKNIEKNSSITNIEIKLTRIKSTISGIVTDGIRPIKNASIILRDKDFNKVASTRSDTEGFYEFYKIPNRKDVFITIMDNNKIILQSELFNLDKNIKNYNLILGN